MIRLGRPSCRYGALETREQRKRGQTLGGPLPRANGLAVVAGQLVGIAQGEGRPAGRGGPRARGALEMPERPGRRWRAATSARPELVIDDGQPLALRRPLGRADGAEDALLEVERLPPPAPSTARSRRPRRALPDGRGATGGSGGTPPRHRRRGPAAARPGRAAGARSSGRRPPPAPASRAEAQETLERDAEGQERTERDGRNFTDAVTRAARSVGARWNRARLARGHPLLFLDHPLAVDAVARERQGLEPLFGNRLAAPLAARRTRRRPASEEP